jgi:circadian clock protein KaiC
LGVLFGTARQTLESQEKAAAAGRQQDLARRQRELERKRKALDAQIADLRQNFAMEEQEMKALTAEDERRETTLAEDRAEMAKSRHAGQTRQKGTRS